MKPSMQMQLSQKLSMTPQLLQSIRYLRMSATEMDAELRDALENNILLEAREEEQPESGDQAGHEAGHSAAALAAPAHEAERDIDYSWDRSGADSWSRGQTLEDEEGFGARIAATDTGNLRTHVLAQLDVICNAHQLAIAEVIVDELDDAGYLPLQPTELLALVREQLPVSAAEVKAVLGLIQQLEPGGLACRSLSECLRVQLQGLPSNTPARDLALKLAAGHLDLLGSHDYKALKAQLQVSEQAVRQAERLILSLDPKPGQQQQQDPGIYIVPEVTVRKQGSNWVVELVHSVLPQVQINEDYEQALEHGSASPELREQLQKARWLVRGLHMRQDTLLRAAQYIFTRQQGFLEQGEIGLQPLTLKEVAEAIQMHESTISRITTNKYVQTPRGVIELKHFFCSTLGNSAGTGVAGTAVRAMVRGLIEREPAQRPLCDGTIAALLERRGVHVARRTVAKYRESMNIPTARLRARTAKAHSNRLVS